MLMLVAVFATLLSGLLVMHAHDSRAAYDQNNYHLVVIQQFADTWPVSNFSDYISATTPGYHWLLGGIGRLISDQTWVLRCFGAIFGIGLVALLGWRVGRSLQWPEAVCVCLPLAMSLYVISSTLWLLPDNAAWLCVLGLLILCWRDESWRWRGLAAAGALLVVLVLFRQIHLWMAAVMWASAALWGVQVHARILPRWSGTGWMGLATLPAFLIVAGFFLLWGGTSPPSMQSHVTGPNAAVPAIILSLLKIYSLFFIAWLWPVFGQVRSNPKVRRWLIIGIAAGLMVGAIPLTTWEPLGRISGLWNLVRALPTVGDRSPLIIVLSALGGGAFVLWVVRLQMANLSQQAQLLTVIWGAFILVNSASAHAWQRYYDPFLLIMLPMIVAALSDDVEKSPPQRQIIRVLMWLGPLLLAVLQLTNTLRVMV